MRSSDRFHNIILLEPQIDTVHYAFKSNNSLFHTAKRLYFSLYRLLSPSLRYLVRNTRRRDMVKELALLSQLSSRRRIIRNRLNPNSLATA